MNPDEEDPRPPPEEPNGAEPASGEDDSPAPLESAAPIETPPSAETVAANESAAPQPEPSPTPDPALAPIEVAAPEAELPEPLASAYGGSPHGLDEPMSDDAFVRPGYEHAAQAPSLFGTPNEQPDIRFPGEGRARGPRARDAQANLDLDLGRIKRRKRYGLFLTTLGVFFVALVLAPVTWALAYLFFDPPSTVLMLQRASGGQAIRHTPVPINRISPYLIRSVIAAEDSNFCTHHGFDVNAIQDALESNAEGGRMRGGSTISQQTAKNLFLWPQRSWVRKGFETYFTALIEFMWPKHRIMEAYLNSAEWGDGNFGAEAAARARFGVSAADLSPLQAARLAAVLPSPNRWRADSPGPYVRRRAASIVERAQVVRNNHMASCVLMIDAPQ
jgi:monofunctional biosynthetic peptidoglycan transglycosylase